MPNESPNLMSEAIEPMRRCRQCGLVTNDFNVIHNGVCTQDWSFDHRWELVEQTDSEATNEQ